MPTNRCELLWRLKLQNGPACLIASLHHVVIRKVDGLYRAVLPGHRSDFVLARRLVSQVSKQGACRFYRAPFL